VRNVKPLPATLADICTQISCLRYVGRLARSSNRSRCVAQLVTDTLLSPGYSDDKISRLTKEAIQVGFNHFKIKVGADLADDLRRGKLIRSIIDDPQYLPEGHEPARNPESPALVGKNAGPTGAVLMIDANQVWDVQPAIDYVTSLAEIKPWCAHIFDLSGIFMRGHERELTCLLLCVLLGSSKSRRRRTTSLAMRLSAAR
jgi:Enolase C-terminal domain-like